MTNPIAANFLNQNENVGSELSEYVAHLQVHIALQSRNLVPYLANDLTNDLMTTDRKDSRRELLQETQMNFEKIASRQ